MHQHAQDRFAAAKRNFMLLVSSAVLSLAPPGARAAWSYDSVAKTITDGNWVLNVVSTTVDGVPGLGITGRNNSTGTGDLDLATFATDVGQPIVSVGGFGAGGAIYWLTSFVGPDVRSAGSQCFRYQKSLTNVVLSAEISTFGASAFDQTTAIKRFYPKTFPNVTSLNSTFCISSIPGDLVFPNVTTLSGMAVRGSGVTSASFPKCKTISIFSGSSALTNVVFDWPATSIQEASLASCGKLTTEIYLAGGTLTKIRSSPIPDPG